VSGATLIVYCVCGCPLAPHHPTAGGCLRCGKDCTRFRARLHDDMAPAHLIEVMQRRAAPDVPAPVDPASLDPEVVAIDQGRAEAEPAPKRKSRAKKTATADVQARLDADFVHTRALMDGTGLDSLSSPPGNPAAISRAGAGLSPALATSHGTVAAAGSRADRRLDNSPHEPGSPPEAASTSGRVVPATRDKPLHLLAEGSPEPAQGTSTSRDREHPPRRDGAAVSKTKVGDGSPAPCGLGRSGRDDGGPLSPAPSIPSAPASSAIPTGGAGAPSSTMAPAAVVPETSGPAAGPQNLPARAATYYDFAADAMQALEQAEADIAFEDEARERQVFHIQTREHLEWYVRLMTEIAAARAHVRAQADRMEAQLEGQLRYLARRFSPEAQPLVDELLAASKPKKRSVDLFAGRIGYRTTPGAPTVADRAAATAWAEGLPNADEFGTFAYRLDARKVIQRVKDTGEAIPGVEFREPRESFYVEAGGQRLDLTDLGAPPALEGHDHENEEDDS
jgi:phage host-nuclease inhibitor protein Gam